jgi:hypothetical protein
MAADLLARVCAEIEGRLAELRPAVDEYQRLLDAAESLAPSSAQPPAPPSNQTASPGERTAPSSKQTTQPRRTTTRRTSSRRLTRIGPVEQAIVAALEHGSHTLSELGMVTAMPAAALREGVRKLLSARKIVRTSREGRTAYALLDSE